MTVLRNWKSPGILGILSGGWTGRDCTSSCDFFGPPRRTSFQSHSHNSSRTRSRLYDVASFFACRFSNSATRVCDSNYPIALRSSSPALSAYRGAGWLNFAFCPSRTTIVSPCDCPKTWIRSLSNSLADSNSATRTCDSDSSPIMLTFSA